MTVYANIGETIEVDCFYQDSDGAGVTGLTVTVDYYDPSGNATTGQSATEVGSGFYKYQVAADETGNWLFAFKTTDVTVIAQHLPALQIVRNQGPFSSGC